MFKLARFAAAVLLAVGMQVVARAQDDEKVSVSANLVSVNVTITDSHGKYVQGLGAEQFEVFDDGVRQRVAHFSAGDAPFSVGVVYDMHPTDASGDARRHKLRVRVRPLAGAGRLRLSYRESYRPRKS
jgi:hypothetical protein